MRVCVDTRVGAFVLADVRGRGGHTICLCSCVHVSR